MNAEAKIAGLPIPGERDPRPIVALPNSGLPGLAIAGIALLLAVLLFLFLNGRREADQATSLRGTGSAGTAFSPPPPLAIPLERQAEAPPPPPLTVVTTAPAAPPVMLRVSPRRAAPAVSAPWQVEPEYQPPPYMEPASNFGQAPPQPPAASFDEPALVMDSGGLGRSAGPVAPGGPAAAGQTAQAGQPTASDRGPSRISQISNPATVMPVGTLIRAVLETPIDTSKPGMARAIVSHDARGFNGEQVLVPRGSRLAGEYQSDVRSGQKRVLINWTQLIRPDGAVIRLDSPAADELGGAGVPGRVGGLSIGRFAQGLLRTALAVGTSLAPWTNRGSIIVGLPAAQVTDAVGHAAGNRGGRRTIRVKQGTAFNVFVARNLDFSAATPSR
ncbi:MAG TPA: TrbI/VirB10 family protein [Allosphingosinicella sp.]|nr:TrbI/VirB10 family protein [Allosphingosinicella sp.]